MNFWRNLTRGLKALVIALAFMAGTVRAQDTLLTSPTGEQSLHEMTVGRHAFAPSSFMKDPFVRTFVRNSLGFGSTSAIEMPPVEIGGEQYNWRTGSLIFAVLEFELQAAFREWLALDMQMNLTGRLANETIPLLSQGVVLITEYEIGALARIYRSRNIILSTAIGVSSVDFADVNVERFVSAIIDTGALTPENALVTTTPATRTFADLRCAYGITEFVGILAQARMSYGEPPERESTSRWFHSIALVLDLNLHRRWNAPIGVGAGFKNESAPSDPNTGGKNLTAILGRVSYVGARDFNLGLDLTYNIVPLRSLSRTAHYFAAVVDMRLEF